MTAASFNRAVTRKLCWVDGSRTHASSAGQRQCRRCRRKWSYGGLAKRWILAQEYCAGRNRREAAAAAGVDVHTAGRHYAVFERALAGYLRRNLKQGRGWIFSTGHPPRPTTVPADKSPGWKLRWAARLCFEGLPFRRRLQLVHDLVFSPRLERIVRGGKRARPQATAAAGHV